MKMSYIFCKRRLVLLAGIVLAGFFLFSLRAIAQSSGTNQDASLSIWEERDMQDWWSNYNITFYANFSNSTYSHLNATQGEAQCEIQFNFSDEYTPYQEMIFNGSSLLWQANRTFNYKGDHQFRVNCTSIYGNITLNDSFRIANTLPTVFVDNGGYIDLDRNVLTLDYWRCTEDNLCFYNFSSNISEPDINDVLTFSYSSSSNTTLTNFTMNSTSGVVAINITLDQNCGIRTVALNVEDDETVLPIGGVLRLNITAVNDAPRFVNLTNKIFNISQLFLYPIQVSDEENNVPFKYNISFVNCSTAEWSTRNSTNCTLFTASDYSANETTGLIMLNFTPTRNDVGTYIINFTVSDSGNVTPQNASTSVIVNFTILNVNQAPYFTYVCENEREGEENSVFSCEINATDIDEISNLTFDSNVTWFLHDNSTIVNSSTGFNGSIRVNLIPTDAQVGNWSINISVKDSASPASFNSTVISLLIANDNDSVTLQEVEDITVYTSNNYTVYVNATDNDLLIPDKRIFNESLNFSSNDTKVTVDTYQVVPGSNRTIARMRFDPNVLGTGNTSVNISVRDSNNWSWDSKVFTISVYINTAPEWDWGQNITQNYSIQEGASFYLNLSENVSDAQNDTLVFSYTNSTSFSSFSVNSSTGVINFTPVDLDVGAHVVAISASDGITPSIRVFNFTVNNANDQPLIEKPISVENATRDSASNVNASEDNVTTLYVIVRDDDVLIPENQKYFYNETLRINLTIQGPNANLFTFDSGNFLSGNRTQFRAIFTPNKSDAGFYNITLNVSDASDLSEMLRFNLSVQEVQHYPTISGNNSVISSITEQIYLIFNATDPEDGISGQGNLTFQIFNLTDGGEFLWINSSTGTINATLNQSCAGFWRYNVSVNDGSGRYNSTEFNLTVYDYPRVLSPASGSELSFKENESGAVVFRANHSIGDSLIYRLYIDGVLKNFTAGNGTGGEVALSYSPNFTDETTCSEKKNITIEVANARLSNFSSWNATINHTNYPLTFNGLIGGAGQIVEGSGLVSVRLSDYFTDLDATDACHNQSIGFNYTSIPISSSITTEIYNWSNGTTPRANFSASASASANYTIYAFEFNESDQTEIISTASSNNFTVALTITTVPETISGGGGGGSSRTVGKEELQKILSLKIIVPEPISAKKRERVVLPIGVENDGTVNMSDILLTAFVSKNGLLRKELIASFDRSILNSLPAGRRENVTLIVDINTQEVGLYEVTINASVRNPTYEDWGKVYIEIRDEGDIEERILFTEELIANNPECAEIKELIDQARALLASGNRTAGEERITQAIEACQEAISQEPLARARTALEKNNFLIVLIVTLCVFFFGIIYYYFQRIRLQKQISFQ